jgi:peroxiredoxin
MAQLRQDYKEFEERDTVILVVGPENSKTFARYFKDNSLPFVGLPDPNRDILRTYGQEIKLFQLGRMPAQVLIDRAGIARFVHYGHDMADIPENAEILSLIDELQSTA